MDQVWTTPSQRIQGLWMNKLTFTQTKFGQTRAINIKIWHLKGKKTNSNFVKPFGQKAIILRNHLNFRQSTFLLCILTSKWELGMPIASKNNLFSIFTSFSFTKGKNKNKNKNKNTKRRKIHKRGSTSVLLLLPNACRHPKGGWLLGKTWFFLSLHENLYDHLYTPPFV